MPGSGTGVFFLFFGRSEALVKMTQSHTCAVMPLGKVFYKVAGARQHTLGVY
jgi:hypothetical protein